MSSKKFIPDKSFLTCDKGSVVTQINVTHNGKVHLYGTKWVTEADIIPNENIFPFGACSITRGSCSFEPIYWDKCQDPLKINGYKPVLEDSCLLCKKGGKITVDFDTPISVLHDIANELGDANHWILGLAIGSEEGITITDKFREFSKQASQSKSNLSSLNKGIALGAKESFGENLSKLDFQAKGYAINGSPHGRSFEQGIDIVARDVKADIDILEETKFKSKEGKPYTNSKKTLTGRQGSNSWFEKRLGKRLPEKDVERITKRLKEGNSNLKKTITKVEPNGTVTRYELNKNGSTGNKITLEPANVVKGNTKASNFINNVSRTIQGNKVVNASNQWLTRNAHIVSIVGKVVGRGTIVVGITLDAVMIYSAYEEEGEEGDKTKQAIGSASGALVGGIAGAKIGAAVGAIGGPVGIIVGGLVGGAIGAIGGSSIGKDIANWF